MPLRAEVPLRCMPSTTRGFADCRSVVMVDHAAVRKRYPELATIMPAEESVRWSRLPGLQAISAGKPARQCQEMGGGNRYACGSISLFQREVSHGRLRLRCFLNRPGVHIHDGLNSPFKSFRLAFSIPESPSLQSLGLFVHRPILRIRQTN